jgi:hypothetical protein
MPVREAEAFLNNAFAAFIAVVAGGILVIVTAQVLYYWQHPPPPRSVKFELRNILDSACDTDENIVQSVTASVDGQIVISVSTGIKPIPISRPRTSIARSFSTPRKLFSTSIHRSWRHLKTK